MNDEWEIIDNEHADNARASSSSEFALPNDVASIERIAARCRRLIRRRAWMTSAASIVPLPGFDMLVDVSMLMKLFDDINAEFGLTPRQIERLSPQRRAFVYQSIVSVGSAVIGRVVTRGLTLTLLRRLGVRLTVKQAARYVPLAGQAASAALSFGAIKYLGDQHVRECTAVARMLIEERELRPSSGETRSTA